MISAVWQLLFSFFPAWFAVALLALLTVIVIFLVLRIISYVLDAIPFV